MPRFTQVDVFTSEKYKGNPLAVFFDADNLSTEEMIAMSRWTNLSEATFIIRPTVEGADYNVRIMSLDEELPFAGHPTIGTCHALLEAGLIKPTKGKIYQQCAAGLVELTITDDSISFKLPRESRKELPASAKERIQQALGIPNVLSYAAYDVGPVWLTARVETADVVIGLKPDFHLISALSKEFGVDGIHVLGPHLQQAQYEVRTFAPLFGIPEDPACGSGAAATAAHLRDFGLETGSVTLKQGCVLGRDATLIIDAENQVTVGGKAISVINGTY